MDINDYLIDHQYYDWAMLLSEWNWLLPYDYRVWWMNKFGDLFLMFEDGSIHFFDVPCGTIEKIADSVDEFYELVNEGANANYWLMIPLVDKLMEAGVTMTEGRCYCFKISPILGGEYSLENSATLSVDEHFRGNAYIYEQIKDLPDGAKVRLKVT